MNKKRETEYTRRVRYPFKLDEMVRYELITQEQMDKLLAMLDADDDEMYVLAIKLIQPLAWQLHMVKTKVD